VTDRLSEQVDAFEPEIADYARYALTNQGKQLRPALLALSGGACGKLGEEHIMLAAVIEMIHLATLVHDDIMDGASLRRGRSTLAKCWGNDVAVLVGDCLFAHALKLAAGFSTAEVCRAVALATHVVCTGEILQTHRRRRWNLGRAEYFKVLEMKTAELFALACELGGRLATGTEAQTGALRRYGLALGTAYQIYDDCVDLFGVEDDAGKSLGTDLAKGKVTLPLLTFFERADATDRAEMISWLENWDPAYFSRVRAKLEPMNARSESCRVIGSFLDDARTSLAILPETPERHALFALTGFLEQQTSALGG
jgi:octaprenyl-diphosphate synthase